MAAYQPQGLPRAPYSGPGLPRRASSAINANTSAFPSLVVVVRTDQLVRAPDWATFYRAGATGRGGDGGIGTTNGAGGGGGGGFAGTNIERINPGSALNVRFDGTATLVECPGYLLSGGNGGNGNVLVGGSAGVGSGGAVNFNGGTGGNGTTSTASSNGGGGGAGGRGGAGTNGVTATTGSANGGDGGNGSGFILRAASGAGGYPSGSPGASATPANLGGSIIAGLPGNASPNFSGGDGGGGGAGKPNGVSVQNLGGAGVAIFEFW